METFVDVVDNDAVVRIFGSLNQNIQSLEKQLDVSVEQAGGGLRVRGANSQNVAAAVTVLKKLLALDGAGNAVDAQIVNYLSESMRSEGVQTVTGYSPDTVCVTAEGRPIKSKTAGQSRYIKAMQKNDIVFATGPAGTGKTFLAVAMAVAAFRRHEVKRIILTRPAVEAGEKLGFLPGDLQMKVDPYMRPLYDSLHELMGAETYLKHMEKGLIEVSPLAYMRGRTLDNAFIILDEAQNTTPEQMKMFLTRMGFNSKVIVTGDMTQIDLPHGQHSGLIEVRRILKQIDGLTFVDLDAKDVVRNDLVQKIVRAYENFENKHSKVEEKSRRRAQ